MCGEIQFCLRWMLKAKKMSHAIYSFVRKEDFFKQLSNLAHYSDYHENLDDVKQNKDKEIKKMILSHNIQKFSNMLENIDEFEKKYIIENETSIVNFIKENQWRVGLKLLQSFQQSWKNN